jgi:hypothetical protein
MAADDVYRRVVVEYGLQYVYLYLADQNGKVLEDESFKQPYRLERKESHEEAKELFAAIYDLLNESINFPTAGN